MFHYAAAGRLVALDRPNGVTTVFDYFDDGRLSAITEGVLADDQGNTLTSATGRYVELTGDLRKKLMQSLGSNS